MTSATVKLSRQRMKALRLNQAVCSPAEHADQLAVQLVAAANSDRAPMSRAERMHVELLFHERYIELCVRTPIRVRRP